MNHKVLIAHADGEEEIAEQLAVAIREAGYEVAHGGTVMVGESVTAEASKVLGAGGPVVLCGTIRAMGTEWAHRIVNAARRYGNVPVFAMQMEELAHLKPLIFDDCFRSYWEDPAKAVEDLIKSLEKYYPTNREQGAPSISADALARYRELALESCDIIDLSNLPETDRHLATRQLELRRLYVALRVYIEIPSDTEIGESSIELMERRRAKRRQDFSAGVRAESPELKDEHRRVPVGKQLGNSKRLIILGDPGAGKTTLIRWIATAYLLRLKRDPAWKDIPDIATLPDEDWLPIVIRCRDLDQSSLNGSLENMLHRSLRRTELSDTEANKLVITLKDKFSQGDALLLLDGLDEITDIPLRIRFCQKLEQICIAYPLAPIVVTSRIVGYREMGYKVGRGFEHLTFDELKKEDKDDFARRWCAITEPPERRESAMAELIHDIHSTDRIEHLTSNPMLLTTLALVKRKVGRLPSRRSDLYWDALEVLINWRREIDEPIDEHEAVPQLEYIAYAMCERGVIQLREDEVLDLLEKMREEYPHIHAMKTHTAEEFLRLLERRTGILIEAGHIRYCGRPAPVFEFRHLSFQEYLSGLALVEGRFPDRDMTKSLAAQIGVLAGQTGKRHGAGDQADDATAEDEGAELTVAENWQEAIRLSIASCNDDDVDAALLAVLRPSGGENIKETTRPRAVHAALCLADDPNVSEDVAREVLECFVRQVNKKDGTGPVKTSIDAAIKELATSRWAEMLQSLLLREFCRRKGDIRNSFGSLYGEIAVHSVSSDEEEIRGLLIERVARLNSQDKMSAISTALQVMTLTYHGKGCLVPRLAEGLLGMLSANGAVAHAAAWALMWLNGERVNYGSWHPSEIEIQKLISLIGSSNYDSMATNFLISILRNERSQEATESLNFKLNSRNKDTQLRAINSLGWIGEPEAVDALVQRLVDRDARIRRAAAVALARIGDGRATDALLSRIEEDDNADVRQQSAWALGWLEDFQEMEFLVARLDDESPKVQQAVMWSLSRIGNTQTMPLIVDKLKSEHDEVRQQAAWSLGRLGDVRAIPALISVLKDQSNKVRQEAAVALGHLRQPHAVEALAEVLNDADFDVQRSAINVLGIIRDESAVDSLLGKLEDANSNVRQAAIWALGRIGAGKAIGPLITLLNDSNVRQQAAVALANSNDSRAIEPLRLKLEDENIYMQSDAAGALGRLGDEQTANLLSADLLSHDRKVWRKAENCLLNFAFHKFKSNDVQGAADIFELILSRMHPSVSNSDNVRNNLAYCFTLLRRYEEAAEQFSLMLLPKGEQLWPLLSHNLGVLAFLMGDTEQGREKLKASLRWIGATCGEYDARDVDCMLLLKRGPDVASYDELPVDAAILLNLNFMGELTREEVSAELARRYRVEHQEWLNYVKV
jgi:HEAT repeat protein